MKRLQIITSPFCNNQCIFCIDNKLRCKLSQKKLNMDAINAIKKAKDKTSKVLFTAGEPTLNPNLIALIKIAKKRGYSEIGLATNGRKLSDIQFCIELLEAGVNDINISIHSVNKKIQNILTNNESSHQETMKAVKNLALLKKRYAFNLGVNSILTKLNLKHIDGYLKKIISYNSVDFINFNTVIPKGRTIKNFDLIVPKYTEIRNVFKKIQNKYLKHSQLPIITILGMPPCVSVGIEKLMGNFEDLLIKNPSLNKENRLLKSTQGGKRVKEKKCRKCIYNLVCQGIWYNYIKERGWKEFISLTDNCFNK